MAYNSLNEEQIELFKSFKDFLILEYPDGTKGFVTHKTSPNSAYQKIIEENGIRDVIFGDTHRTYDKVVDGIHYFNPGGIGLTEDSIYYGGTYGVIEATDTTKKYGTYEFQANAEKRKEIDQSVINSKELSECGWNKILLLSLDTGRNMACVFFRELQRITAIYKEESRNYNPNDFETSLYMGYYDVDMYGKPLYYDNKYKSVISSQEINVNNFAGPAIQNSDLKLLLDSEIRKSLVTIALNNTIYYATVYQSNSKVESPLVENPNLSYR